MENKLLSKRDLISYLDCSLGMVDKLMKEDLPYIKIGKSVKFRRNDIDNYISDNQIQ
jgi:hypothetical protein|tara:strand:- start:1810 stop:1980 length:171 start_codon:yes stop_codon:yes gene_type:complete